MKHYAISDLHGMYNIYEQVCAMLTPEDIVYFLGDAGDRGYANWETIKAIYNNPQWVYLKGNHEDMMAQTLFEIQSKRPQTANNLWMHNGGRETKEGWIKDGADLSWAEKLQNLPLTADYTNKRGYTFHMSHAGYTCGNPRQMLEHELVWNRNHFFDYWHENKFPKDICIHGHTPLEYMQEEMQWHERSCDIDLTTPIAFEYCDGHKIDIDNGVFYTGHTVLYDLDEMKAIPLFDKNFKVEEVL